MVGELFYGKNVIRVVQFQIEKIAWNDQFNYSISTEVAMWQCNKNQSNPRRSRKFRPKRNAATTADARIRDINASEDRNEYFLTF